MSDQKQDPTEREREDEDLEMDPTQAEDVKGGATAPLTQAQMLQQKINAAIAPPTTTTSPFPTKPTTTDPYRR